MNYLGSNLTMNQFGYNQLQIKQIISTLEECKIQVLSRKRWLHEMKNVRQRVATNRARCARRKLKKGRR